MQNQSTILILMLSLSLASEAGEMLTEEQQRGESLFLRKLLWASLPNKRQKSRDR